MDCINTHVYLSSLKNVIKEYYPNQLACCNEIRYTISIKRHKVYVTADLMSAERKLYTVNLKYVFKKNWASIYKVKSINIITYFYYDNIKDFEIRKFKLNS